MELQERLGPALADRYEVEGEVGRGGMAVVFRALRHARTVALRVPRSQIVGLGLGLLGLLCCTSESAVPASIEVLPSALSVVANTSFEVVARIRDASGAVVPETPGEVVAWRTSGPWLEVQKAIGRRAILYAHGWFAGGTTGSFTVTAQAGGVSSEPAAVTVQRSPGGPDRIVANAVAGMLNAAIVDGVAATAVVDDRVVGFDAEALLDDLIGGGPVAFFSVATRMGFEAKPWSSDPDLVDFTALDVPISVPVAVWIAVSDDQDAMVTLANADLALANALYQAGRSGFRFSNSEGTKRVDGEDVGSRCADADAWVSATGHHPGAFTLDAVNVYYVEEVTETSAGKAVWCPGTAARPEPVVYVPANASRTDVTLTHELGHTVALRHVYVEGGEQTTNIMDGNWSGATRDPRDQVSLGQGFRGNLDPASWINKRQLRGPAAPTASCGCPAPTDTSCPVIYLDLLPAVLQYLELCPS